MNLQPSTARIFPARDYDLAATLTCGQAFRWRAQDDAWLGVVAGRWVQLRSGEQAIHAETTEPVSQWDWLSDYLQIDLDLGEVLRTFPEDEPMRVAADASRGLRLLRQDPWECLASFILSSTKQIVQIQQIIALLCARFGDAVTAPEAFGPAHAFPSATRLAAVSESELRDCKMGFRAPYLLGTAKAIATGEVQLSRLQELPVREARAALMSLPGVGRKIADCVLLFAYGFQSAFPVDVWVMKALRELYFPRRRPSLSRLHRFAETHFGPNAGYAQQYLFHYMRTRSKAPTERERLSAA
jgi:N-glycosylase/DNA lyase